MNAVGLVVKIEELVMKQSARKIWEKIAKIMSVQHRAQIFDACELGATACQNHVCAAPGAGEGYLFSKAMENPGFISVTDIQDIYMPMGFSNFKIEGRGLGSALIWELLLYYMTKPEYQIHVREKIYLDNMLDLF